MNDLETVGTGSHAAIISIGAVFFDLNGLGTTFYQAVRPTSNHNFKREMDGDTICGWMKQSEEARKVWQDPSAVDLDIALKRMHDWAKMTARGKIKLWGNGSDFDNIILGNAYDATKQPKFWQYNKNRCFRTMRAELCTPDEAKALWDKHAKGTHHNALDEAIRQANILIEIYNAKNLVLGA